MRIRNYRSGKLRGIHNTKSNAIGLGGDNAEKKQGQCITRLRHFETEKIQVRCGNDKKPMW